MRLVLVLYMLVCVIFLFLLVSGVGCDYGRDSLDCSTNLFHKYTVSYKFGSDAICKFINMWTGMLN